MDTLKINFDTCFGINKLQETFNFKDCNAVAIYAKNGVMKTSFTKTFQKIQQQKSEEIRDEIFEIPGSAIVEADGIEISPDSIFVINSFESTYEADVTPLLIDEDMKEQLKDVLNLQKQLFKKLEDLSGLKGQKIVQGKKVFELEPQIISDFSFEQDSFLVNIEQFGDTIPTDCDFANVKYNSIFDEGVLKKILDPEFQKNVSKYVEMADVLYDNYEFLGKGNLTMPKLKDLRKNLDKSGYFIQGNQLLLLGTSEGIDLKNLDKKISEVEKFIKQSPEFRNLEKLLSDVKGRTLKDLIETMPQIIGWLREDKLQELRKILWLAYLKSEQNLFSELKNSYMSLSAAINEIDMNHTAWQEALDVYKKRFTVPYKMEITNLKGAIMGASLPRITFSFEKNNQQVTLSKNRLEEINVLSQGEKRALYLLNIIFDIEQRKKSGKETLFIIDDIADSFDYKNKYAIVEYLQELMFVPGFKMIILSHNFDFYRTLTSRLRIKDDNCLAVENNGSQLTFVPETYHKDPFKKWKNNPSDKIMIAMIPLARNLVDFGKERTANTLGLNDKRLLTSLLHAKAEAKTCTFNNLAMIYSEYLGLSNVNLSQCIHLNHFVLDSIKDIADSITVIDNKLEDKLVLAIAIRHQAEEYMIKQINIFPGVFTWTKKGSLKTGNNVDYLKYVSKAPNQTNELFCGLKQIQQSAGVGDDIIRILEDVNLMTPENIHLNSFMFEPLLDMDINELLHLYDRVKALNV